MSDLIDRQAAIDAIYKESKYANSEVADEYADMFVYALKTLPSVQKTGKWVYNIHDRPICDRCGYMTHEYGNYCPNCGSKNENGYQQGKFESQKWIPISERFPKDGQEILATIKDTRYKNPVIIRHYDSELEEKLLVAWMPLPEPYMG